MGEPGHRNHSLTIMKAVLTVCASNSEVSVAVIHFIRHRVPMVCYSRILDCGSAEDISHQPTYPATQPLLWAMPVADPEFEAKEIMLEGEISALAGAEGTCRFAPRCPARSSERCVQEEPRLKELRDGHLVACHVFD